MDLVRSCGRRERERDISGKAPRGSKHSSLALWRWLAPPAHQTFHPLRTFSLCTKWPAGHWVWAFPSLSLSVDGGRQTVAGRPRELKILQCGLVASTHWPWPWPLASSAPCLPLSFSTVSGRTDGGRLAGIAWADPPMAERAGAPTHKHTRAGQATTTYIKPSYLQREPQLPLQLRAFTLTPLYRSSSLCCFVSHRKNPAAYLLLSPLLPTPLC